MPYWLDRAYRYRGMREIPGKQHNPTIIKWLKGLKAWWSEDETPWCGTFVAEMLRQSGVELPKHWYRALAWRDYGIPVTPRMGCIMVKERKGGGHVFFYAGETPTHYLGLGGNQANCVNITPFPKQGVKYSFRWPSSVPAVGYKSHMTTMANVEGKEGGGEA